MQKLSKPNNPVAIPLKKHFEVLTTSLKLGITSFGGPIAHIGYFHEEYVRKKKWVDESTFADLPFRDILRRNSVLKASLTCINAAVVGILLAALYNPIWITAISSTADFVLAVVLFVMLVFWKLPPWIIVATGAFSGAIISRVV